MEGLEIDGWYIMEDLIHGRERGWDTGLYLRAAIDENKENSARENWENEVLQQKRKSNSIINYSEQQTEVEDKKRLPPVLNLIDFNQT